MEKTRIATFDILKGIGILLVIIGHTFMKEIGLFIQAFHMPLFFIVAGYFFKYQSFLLQVKRDFRRLIVPYLFVVIAITIFDSIKRYWQTGVVDFNIGTLYECGTPAWFLLALFGSKLLFNLVYRYTERHYLLVAFSLSSIPCFITHFVEISPTFSIGSSICGVFFYAFGYFIKCNDIFFKLDKYRLYVLVSALFFWLNTSIFGAVDMHYSIFKLWIIDFIGACSGVYLCYVVSKVIELHFSCTGRILALAGYYSLVIYAFHAIEYVFPDWHQIASFSDGAILRPYVIMILRLLFASVFVLITVKTPVLYSLFFPELNNGSNTKCKIKNIEQ